MDDAGRAVERRRRARFLKGTAARRPAPGPDGLLLESLRAPPGLALTFGGREVNTSTARPLKARITPSTQEGQAMTATSQRRDEQIAAFYRDHAERLERAVRRRVHRVGDEVIEDACQVAWVTLLRRPDIPLDAHGLSWLSTVAVHEAWRLGSIMREQPAGTLTP